MCKTTHCKLGKWLVFSLISLQYLQFFCIFKTLAVHRERSSNGRSPFARSELNRERSSNGRRPFAKRTHRQRTYITYKSSRTVRYCTHCRPQKVSAKRIFFNSMFHYSLFVKHLQIKRFKDLITGQLNFGKCCRNAFWEYIFTPIILVNKWNNNITSLIIFELKISVLYQLITAGNVCFKS